MRGRAVYIQRPTANLGKLRQDLRRDPFQRLRHEWCQQADLDQDELDALVGIAPELLDDRIRRAAQHPAVRDERLLLAAGRDQAPSDAQHELRRVAPELGPELI